MPTWLLRQLSINVLTDPSAYEHCEQTIADALQDVSGVTDVSVDREAEQANVDGNADVSALIEAVENAGYTAHA